MDRIPFEPTPHDCLRTEQEAEQPRHSSPRLKQRRRRHGCYLSSLPFLTSSSSSSSCSSSSSSSRRWYSSNSLGTYLALFCVFLELLSCHTATVSAEYTWNGSDWVWNESSVSNKLNMGTSDCRRHTYSTKWIFSSCNLCVCVSVILWCVSRNNSLKEQIDKSH